MVPGFLGKTIIRNPWVRDPLRETVVIDRKKASKPLSRTAGKGG